jgi:iron-sulfur cluster assembly protein
MSISLSESAAQRVRDRLASRGHGIGLRVGVKPAGCSGFRYVVDYADEALAGDLMFESQGVKLFVDGESLPAIDGMRIDFVRQGLNETFRFENPNVRGECGCGESFTVE